jgi:hypothetical protein
MLRIVNTESSAFPERDCFPTGFTLRGTSLGFTVWGVASSRETLEDEGACEREPP